MSCTVDRILKSRGHLLEKGFSTAGFFCWGYGCSMLLGLCAAEEPKTAAKPQPPTLLMASPIGLTIGETNRISLRGLNLTNAISGQLIGPGGASRSITLQSSGSANAIEGFDIQRVGDQKLELELVLDSSFASGTNNRIVLKSPAGESSPFYVFAARPEEMVSEKEPNNSFRDAALAKSGMIIRGAIDAAGDVDVFQFEVEPGDKFRAEVFAERLGSTLDAALSLYDHNGNLVLQTDDVLGRDPRIEWVATKLEAIRVVISSVNEKAAPSHQYLLKLESTKVAH